MGKKHINNNNNSNKKPAPKKSSTISRSNNGAKKKASLPPVHQQQDIMWKKLKTGSRVGIYWPDDECYYLCTVESQCSNPRTSSRFFVRYEDNVCEWINMATEQLMLLEDDYWYDLSKKIRIRRKFNDGKFYIAQVMYGMKWFFDNDKNKNVLTRQVKYTADDQEEWLDREQLNRWAYNDKKEKDKDDEDDNEEDVYGENAVDKTTTKQSKNAIGN